MAGYFIKLLLCAPMVAITVAATALACPTINGLVDFNCDQKLRLAITGDSFVRGVGDTSIEGGGYVQRLQDHYPDAQVLGIGVPGITTSRLLESFKKAFSKNGATKKNSLDTDLYIIDVGRNDFWAEKNPAITVRNIRRLVKYIRDQVKKSSGVEPLVGVATLAPTKRGYERSFISAVNMQLIAARSSAIPVYVRMDTLDISLISLDGLHPSADGYDALAKILENYASHIAKPQQLSKRRDADVDGIYDNFETRKFGTDPKIADTDGDSYSDGQEVFVDHSDPLNPQSFGAQATSTPSPSPTLTPAPMAPAY